MKHTPNISLLTLVTLVIFRLTAFAADDAKAGADNSKKNERDRNGQTTTAGDQSNSPEDLKVTQAIRQAVVKDSGLTMTAKNVKIITIGGVVTLRGPVNSAEEKAKIEQLAKASAGSVKVDNQLEVKSAPAK